MTLKVLGSESAGNCYLLESFFEILIIEAGIRLNDVKKSLNLADMKIHRKNAVGARCRDQIGNQLGDCGI